ncbi:MAG: hydroxymethylglutaryl-CoA lyase [Phycisphaerales bacterium]|nr:hydroxymethylglutaryl-CoA lyase [Phycisphaerales bacterium]
MSLPSSIRITDVGPRDGLQNEQTTLSVEAKIDLVNRLARSGVAEVEVSSFVNPQWVPQLADAAEVFAGIERVDGVTYSALVPNMQGWERARAAGVDRIAVFTTASETFAQRNTNCTIAESLERFAPVVEAARAAGVGVRGYVSCAVACPYEGPVDPKAVRNVSAALLDLGIDELDLGDTIGVAVVEDIDRLLAACASIVEPSQLSLHLHDTGRGALACCLHAMQCGVRRFDASCGGLGGCPYAPGASGNLATEDLVGMCRAIGVETNVDLDGIMQASATIESAIGRSLSCRGGSCSA